MRNEDLGNRNHAVKSARGDMSGLQGAQHTAAVLARSLCWDLTGSVVRI